MAGNNVVALPGSESWSGQGQANPALVMALEDLLERAKSGQLQSFIGVGFTSDGLRLTTWADFHSNVCEMLGALEWVKAEYIHRHTSGGEA